MRLGSRVVRGSGVPGSSAVVVGGCRLCFSPGWGVGVGFFLLVVVGVLGVLFSAWHSLCFFGSGLGPCGLVGVGGFGGCWVGLGFVFSGCYCLARAGAGSSLVVGLVLVWVWFCLESLILAQDERWRRA